MRTKDIEIIDIPGDVFYVNDNGKITCNLQSCDDEEFLAILPYRRISVKEFLDAWSKHLVDYHLDEL